MLQIANTFFKLPGDYLSSDADEISGFKQILTRRLSPAPGTRLAEEDTEHDWTIGDTLAQWWRPNFEIQMYPFLNAHVTRPKESKKVYLVELPARKVLSVPKNMKLLAVPLFELYDNSSRYGPQLSAIPHMLSRYNFEFVDEQGKVVSVTPGGGPYGSISGGSNSNSEHGGGEATVPITKVLAEDGQAAGGEDVQFQTE